MDSPKTETRGFASDRPDDYIGNPAQREMQRRAYRLWQSVSSDPRYAYEGRLVAMDGAAPDTIDDLLFLIREQLAGLSWHVKADDEVALTEKLTTMGYAIDRWDHHLAPTKPCVPPSSCAAKRLSRKAMKSTRSAPIPRMRSSSNWRASAQNRVSWFRLRM